MLPTNVVRWSRLSFLLSGVFIILFFVLHPLQGDPPPVNILLTTPYALEHTLGVITLVLGLLGLIGVYVWLAQTRRWLALISFLLAFIGSALLIGDVFVDGYIAPILAAHAPGLLGPSSPLMANPPPLFFLVPGLIWGLGYIVLGIATLLRDGGVRWAGVLLIVGAGLASGVLPLPFLGEVAGAVVLGLGQIWLGYVLWSTKAETVTSPVLAS